MCFCLPWDLIILLSKPRQSTTKKSVSLFTSRRAYYFEACLMSVSMHLCVHVFACFIWVSIHFLRHHSCRLYLSILLVLKTNVSGNPGIPEYYVQFMLSLWEKNTKNIPVWCVGQAGHVAGPKTSSLSWTDIFKGMSRMNSWQISDLLFLFLFPPHVYKCVCVRVCIFCS